MGKVHCGTREGGNSHPQKGMRGCPAEMEEGDLGAAGVLNEAGESVEEGGNAEADDDGDDDPDVREEVGARLRRCHGEGFTSWDGTVPWKNSNSVTDGVCLSGSGACAASPCGLELVGVDRGRNLHARGNGEGRSVWGAFGVTLGRGYGVGLVVFGSVG